MGGDGEDDPNRCYGHAHPAAHFLSLRPLAGKRTSLDNDQARHLDLADGAVLSQRHRSGHRMAPGARSDGADQRWADESWTHRAAAAMAALFGTRRPFWSSRPFPAEHDLADLPVDDPD